MPNNITPILTKMRDDILSIQELSLKSFRKTTQKGGKILNHLFEKYFGDNAIIPYDIEERKALYPLAFKELKDYTKVYENKVGEVGLQLPKHTIDG